MDRNMCMELALEGERLCKSGDFVAGVKFLEAAVQAGSEDMKLLSAIYSQLGNGYFYLGDYSKALEYHKNDLTLARSLNDRLGEAKASGNIGNTLKVLGRYDDAVVCCRRHLDISRELGDRVGEGRALYNLGNIYHAKGKHIGRLGHQDPGEFPEEVKACLHKAIEYYKSNFGLVTELGDRSARGRCSGNLGNIYYLLGSFRVAITYHEERLAIAKEFGDKAAERRAYSNMANANIFLGEFEKAAEQYKRTLALAQELGDRALEAQSNYSLGNTYTLLHNYPVAIEYHAQHLAIAVELMDKIGEARGNWALGHAHSALGHHEKALHYANRHLEISKEIGDSIGQATAQMNLVDFRNLMGVSRHDGSKSDVNSVCSHDATTGNNGRLMRRVSMENMDLLKLTPDVKSEIGNKKATKLQHEAVKEELKPECRFPTRYMDKTSLDSLDSAESNGDQDRFYELLFQFQGNRMDDQRCDLNILENKENEEPVGSQRVGALSPQSHNCFAGESSSSGSNSSWSKQDSATSASSDGGLRYKEDLLDMIAGLQSKRMDEQRASLPHLPGLNNNNNNNNYSNNNNIPRMLQRASVTDADIPDDEFFDMLMRCQGARLEDQRSVLPGRRRLPAPTVPDEDFFSLIIRLQSGRLEDQRSSIAVDAAQVVSKAPACGKGKAKSSRERDVAANGAECDPSKSSRSSGKSKHSSKSLRSLRQKRH